MGSPLGFHLLNDFSAMNYMYFGNFSSLRPELVVWRVKMLVEIVTKRTATLKDRVKVGIVSKKQAGLLEEVLERIQIWVAVTSKEDKATVATSLTGLKFKLEVFSLEDIGADLAKLGN